METSVASTPLRGRYIIHLLLTLRTPECMLIQVDVEFGEVIHLRDEFTAIMSAD